VTPEVLVLTTSIGIAAGVFLTVAMVVRLVRIARQPELARAPVAAAVPVRFEAAGDAELAIEGPLFTSRFRGLSFELVDPAGMPVALRQLLMRASSGGFSHAHVALPLRILQPGAYSTRRLDPATDYGDCAVVFVRPYAASLFVTVVALLASIGLTAASVAVAAALLVRAPVEQASPPSPEKVARPTLLRAPTVDVADGRRLRSDPQRLGDAQELVWPLVQLRLRVPRDWIVRKLSGTELDLRHPTTPSTFVVAHVTPMPAGPTFEQYVDAHVAHARDRLAERMIDGYATKRIGVVPGVVTLEHRDDGGLAMITWTGFQPAAVGSLSVTLLAGAAADDFARDESLLGAIVDSARFE
jgi:hypothetical protein